MRSSVGLLCVIAASLLSACSRPDDEPVAEVSGSPVTAGEFRVRFSEYLNATGVRDNVETRRAVLNNMINERLIREHLRRSGWDQSGRVQRRFHEIRTQALLDAYATGVLLDTMTISEQELRDEFRRRKTKMRARYVYDATREGALKLKRRLEAGETFERLAREVFDDPGLANNGGSVGYFGYGDMESAFEDTAFNMPVGRLSEPTRIGIGYAIIRVDDRVTQPLASEYDYAKDRPQLEESITLRKARSIMSEVSRRIVEELSPRFNEDLVSQIDRQWNRLRRERSDEAGARMWGRDFAGDTLMVCSKFAWTAGEFVEQLDFVNERQWDEVRSVGDVQTVISGLAVRKELLDRAEQLNLGSDAGFLRQTDQLMLRFALNDWTRSVEDTVELTGEDEPLILNYFKNNISEFHVPPEINVSEILVRSRQEAESIRNRLMNGAPFADLARRYSIRVWAAKQNGELGYRSPSEYGILGEKFLTGNVGDIVGPEYVDPYYGLFKILGKRDGRPMTFAEADPLIREQLLTGKKRQAVRSAVAMLREQYSFEVFDERLQAVPLLTE